MIFVGAFLIGLVIAFIPFALWLFWHVLTFTVALILWLTILVAVVAVWSAMRDKYHGRHRK